MRSDRDILLVSVFTFITVITWVYFELVKTVTTSTVSKVTEQMLVPLPKSIDRDTLTLLEERQIYK